MSIVGLLDFSQWWEESSHDTNPIDSILDYHIGCFNPDDNTFELRHGHQILATIPAHYKNGLRFLNHIIICFHQLLQLLKSKHLSIQPELLQLNYQAFEHELRLLSKIRDAFVQEVKSTCQCGFSRSWKSPVMDSFLVYMYHCRSLNPSCTSNMNPIVDNPQTYNWSRWAEKQPIPGLWGQLPDDPAERQVAVLQALQADITFEPTIESPGPSSHLWCISMLKAMEKEQDHQQGILHNHLTESPKSSMEISHSPVLKKKRGRPKGVQNSIIKMPSSQVRSPLQLRSHTRSGQLSSVDNAMYNDSMVPVVDSGANSDNISKETDVSAPNLSTLSFQHCGSQNLLDIQSALNHHDSVKEKAAIMIITPACESTEKEELIPEHKEDNVQLVDTFDISDDQLEYVDLEEFNQPPSSILSAPCSTATSDGSENIAQSSFLLTSSVCPEEPSPAVLGPSSSNDNTCHNTLIDLDPNLLALTESKTSKGTLIFSQVRSTTQAGFDYDSVTLRFKSKVKKNKTSKQLSQTKQSKNLPMVSRNKKKGNGKEMEMEMDLNQENNSEPSEVQSKSQALQTMIANLTKVAHSCQTAKQKGVLQWNPKFLMFFSVLAQEWRKSKALQQDITFTTRSIMSSKDMLKQAHISMHDLILYVAWMKNTQVELNEAQKKEKDDALHGFKILFQLLDMK